ncbi:putative AC transposase [Fusarium oxysporum f. sp. raphani]|uniref:Putative AC transposase n=1 Tax=Fusarium oxysporum f. sp. raphani TaxID=96318 RepID=A0A8J5PP60_FUSOX|nr:putative AC transposase [Fusarium oxysporum f. sp. raphani]
MALSTNPDISAALFSTTSTASSDLDTATGFNRSDDNTEANVDISSTAHSGSGHRFWLCKECHQTKAAITHMYDAPSTSQANGHMEDVHRINRGGKMSPRRKKQRTLFDMVGLDARQGKDQAVMNAFITSFDPLRFQRLLIRWVACDNVPFNTLESPYFRELMEYANSAIIESGSLPTHNTMREWIVRTFNRHKGVVTELLGRSLSRINVSFDVWTSRKFTSLLGLTVHFLDDEGKFRTFLLGLPQIEGRHCGENLAGRVSEIIYEYGFEGRMGYFVTDNAESNDTRLEELATELGFNKQHYRLRCCGHIINLVARSILFGTDADAFEEDCQADKELQDEMRLWRAKGPIGKLHNIVHWVQRSGQRIDKLHKLQSIENTALGLEDRSTYDVITDNATRWNSSEAMMERGYQLRNPLDSLVQAEVTEWDQGYGKYGAIWEVLLTMEWLLQHLEDSKLQHEQDEEPYLRIGCNLGWMKLDKYYTLTEDSPVYLASLVLHPAFRWPSVESQWADHPDWLERGKIAVRELWEEYQKLPIEQDTIPEQPTAARKTTDLDDFMASARKLSTQRAPSAPPTRDEYAEWLSTSDPGDCLVDNPIQYWLLRRRQYPRLSRMAIDLFSVPAMSSEPERIFSLAGQMVTPPRKRLQADIVGAARCISSWEKSGAIEISK